MGSRAVERALDSGGDGRDGPPARYQQLSIPLRLGGMGGTPTTTLKRESIADECAASKERRTAHTQDAWEGGAVLVQLLR